MMSRALVLGRPASRLIRLVLAGSLAVGCRALLEIEEKELVTDGGALGDAGGDVVHDAADGVGADAACPLVCADVCVDPMTDEKNCGRCGHDCRAPCGEGRCVGRQIATGVRPSRLRQAGATLFVTTDTMGGRVLRLPKKGSDDRVIAQNVGGNVDLVVSEPWLYVASPSQARIARVGTDGGVLEDLALGETNAARVTADGVTLFFARSAPNDVRALPLAGAPPTTLVTPVAAPTWIGADDTYVFYASSTLPDVGVWRIAKDGSGKSRIDTAAATKAALDQDAVYAFDTATFTIRRIPKLGADAPMVLAEVGGTAGGLAVDDAFVYFTTGNLVRRAPKGAPGTAEDVAIGSGAAGEIVVGEAGDLFWTTPQSIFSAWK
jgi:hypothetical protein